MNYFLKETDVGCFVAHEGNSVVYRSNLSIEELKAHINERNNLHGLELSYIDTHDNTDFAEFERVVNIYTEWY